MNVIFTCGGTGGHINPAIAVANIWKQLIITGVDLRTEITYVIPFSTIGECHVDIFSSVSTRCIADKVQCVARSIESRVPHGDTTIII